jgi:hypothetical protein
MSNAQGIATTIKSQLYAMDRNLMMGLGAKDFSVDTTKEGLACLFFKVKGVKHKGYVQIAYNEGLDLYNVSIFTIRNYEKKTKYAIEGVYVDGLPAILEDHCY